MENEQFSCVVCHALPIDVLESGCCSSLFCWECAVAISGNCPSCHANFDREACKVNLPLRRIIDNFPRKCKFFGCNQVLKGLQMSDHIAICPERLLVCPNSDLCGLLTAKDLDSHLTTKCDYRLVSCHLCDTEEILYLNLKEHLEKDCEGVTITCPNRCSVQLKRKEIEQHRQECRFELIPCEFASCGCNARLTRIAMAEHLENSAVQKQHLYLMKKHFEATIEELKRNNSNNSSNHAAVNNNTVRPNNPVNRPCLEQCSFSAVQEKVTKFVSQMVEPDKVKQAKELFDRYSVYAVQGREKVHRAVQNIRAQLTLVQVVSFLFFYQIFSSLPKIILTVILFVSIHKIKKSHSAGMNDRFKQWCWIATIDLCALLIPFYMIFFFGIGLLLA